MDDTDKEAKETNTNKKKGKTKKSKGIDFMDYCNDNGIKLNLQYEDVKLIPNTINKPKKDKDINQKNFAPLKPKKEEIPKKEPKEEDKTKTDHKTNFGNEDHQFKSSPEEKRDFYNEKIDANEYDQKPYYKKRNYYQNDYSKEYQDDYQSYHSIYSKDYQNNYQEYNYDYRKYKNNNDNYYDNKDYNTQYYGKFNKNYNNDYYYNKRNNEGYNNNSRYKKGGENIAIELPDPSELKKEEVKKEEINPEQKEKLDEIPQDEKNKPKPESLNEKPGLADIPAKNKFDKSTIPPANTPPVYFPIPPPMERPMIHSFIAPGSNFYADTTQININPFSPEVVFPVLDEDILYLLEFYVSNKNLNLDLNLREKMDENGWIPIEAFLGIKKLSKMDIDKEKVKEVISKIGSDFVEFNEDNNGLFLRNRNFNEEKDQIMSIEDIKKIKEENLKKFNEAKEVQNQINQNVMNQMQNPQFQAQQKFHMQMMMQRQAQMMHMMQMNMMNLQRQKMQQNMMWNNQKKK